LLFEIFAGQEPYQNIGASVVALAYQQGNFEIIEKLGSLPPHTPEIIQILFSKCLNLNPGEEQYSIPFTCLT